MGKRQVRIFRKDLEKHVPILQQQPAIQVVLRNKAVVVGCISATTANSFELQDFRFNKHNLKHDDIEEVFYDVEAPY